MSPESFSFINEFYLFNENLSCNTFLTIQSYAYSIYLLDFAYSMHLFNTNDFSLYTNSVLSFINQMEDSSITSNLENIASIYHYSIPNTKLAYPEPFIAAPSFMHSDLWFVHILVYQYWLWFVFVFIIVFFFITFVCTVRWCNMRVRPRRETRGVSRSKCGDLITACVPVTWATSIIVNESTDAIDYYDGFGSTELVVGIRAYQWGWEYYYPKDIDLNYNIKQNYSFFVGNSLKYEKASDLNLKANNLWKFYQNKQYDQVVTPAFLLTTPLDNFKLLNFLNFQDVGAASTIESNAFKKVRMFSKTNNLNLVNTVSNFSFKYLNFSNSFINDNLFTESYLYGLKRQHNFISSKSFLNNQVTFLNLNSVNKLLEFNLNQNHSYSFNLTNYNNFNYTNRNQYLTSNSNLTNALFLTSHFSNNSYLNFYSNFVSFNKFISLIGDNSDSKTPDQPIFKLFNKRFNQNQNSIVSIADNLNDINVLDSNEASKLFETDKTSRTHFSFSPNQSVLVSSRYVRNFLNINPSRATYNHTQELNPVNEYLRLTSSTSGLNSDIFSNLSNSNWISPSTFQKFSTSKLYFDYPYSPIISNNKTIDSIEYDNLNNSFIDETPTVLQGKEELIPTSLANAYWNFYWASSSLDWRLFNSSLYSRIHSLHYLPLFTLYYDYDFRNWQSLELLEDSFWESTYSSYTHDEFVSLVSDFYTNLFLDKSDSLYNLFNKNYSFKNKIIESPLYLESSDSNAFYANSFQLDDNVASSELVSTKDFFIFPLYTSLTSIDESYDSLKFLNYIYQNNNNIFLNNSTDFNNSLSYLFIFDSFRSDYDEFSWFVDDYEDNLSHVSKYAPEKMLDAKLFFNETDLSSNENELVNYSSSRFSNYVNLRSSVKSSLVTYNAIQKVFRTRFDENRSNTKLADLGYFFNKQLFLSSPRIQYEHLLGKTKNNYFLTNLYKSSFLPYINSNSALMTGLNYYFFDFPFLIALKSDASRYLWFDWYAKWGFYEVQPSSSSRYAIYGMPYFSKNFEFNTVNSENLNESETYALRIFRARRNYLPNWVYTPYFYSKQNNWYKNNLFYEIFDIYNNSLVGVFWLLINMTWYWENKYLFNYFNYQFNPSNSGITSYARLNWKPQNSIQSYYYNVSTVIDILTKREFLYRELFSLNNKITNIPFYLTSSPNNPLINEIKSTFLFADPICLNNEYSRNTHYNSLQFFNNFVLKVFFSNFNSFLNLSFITNYLFYYFFNEDLINKSNTNDLYKSQYRPLRKGITNMIRLHATGAIAMPIEIRLQVLASSKDVIHSWAIPSAGIKIDCVPGYSSHKVMIFLVSGIFWGQCMEICGRYHHWMPIVIYFMKRDLFFLWCTHFVFLTGSNNMWNINDRSYTDYIRTVSVDKNSWVNELN